jgi:hypothetical protein
MNMYHFKHDHTFSEKLDILVVITTGLVLDGRGSIPGSQAAGA